MVADPVYSVELKDGEEYGSFQVGDENVTLDAGNRVWSTSEYQLYRQIRDALPPFLSDLGAAGPKKIAKGGDA